jgi:hypothetical protein
MHTMTSFISIAQLTGPSQFASSTTATPAKPSCMFCGITLRADKEYERHLEELHPGWAMVLLQKIGMKVVRENG